MGVVHLKGVSWPWSLPVHPSRLLPAMRQADSATDFHYCDSALPQAQSNGHSQTWIET
jgi:hypothetical protein